MSRRSWKARLAAVVLLLGSTESLIRKYYSRVARAPVKILIAVLGIVLASSCGLDDAVDTGTTTVDPPIEEPEVGGPPIDWQRSPLAGADTPASASDIDSLQQTAGFALLDSTELGATTDSVYTDGISLAIVLSSPPTWIIQGALDAEGLRGLDASDPAYEDAEQFGTKVSNVVLPDGKEALQIEGGGSITILFAHGDSLIQISAPPDVGIEHLYEFAVKIGP